MSPPNSAFSAFDTSKRDDELASLAQAKKRVKWNGGLPQVVDLKVNGKMMGDEGVEKLLNDPPATGIPRTSLDQSERCVSLTLKHCVVPAAPRF